jgi:L-fucose isomerase-like protein
MKAGILFFGRKRPGFDPDWGRQIERQVRETLEKSAYGVYLREEYVVDDDSLLAAVASCRAQGVDVLFVLQPTMSDGRLSVRLGQEWPGTIVLWATPERPDAEKVTACSLVGAHVFGANLRQAGHPVELVTGMPGDPFTMQEFDHAFRTAYARDRLRGAKIGLIGYHAPGFIDMHADPAALAAQPGCGLYHTGLHDLLDHMAAVEEKAALADAASVLESGMALQGVTQDDLPVNSRVYLAVKAILAEENLDAIAIREWPELPNLTGHWPYLAFSRLLDENTAIACEGDVDGAITSLTGCLLGFGPGYLSDWLAHDEETITLWHGGCAPAALCDPPGTPHAPVIARHFNSDKPAVINARLTPGKPLTLCRIWHCDGVCRMMAAEVNTLEPEKLLAGTTGLVELNSRHPNEWLRMLISEGMPHHVTAFPGRQAGLLRRFARLADIEMVD